MSTLTSNRLVDILLVEDNPGDVRLTVEALRENQANTQLHVTRDGVEALSFLRRQEPFHSAPRPSLVIMDLNMPHKDGREFLAEIKQDPALSGIPVVILTNSQSDSDIRASYNLHASCYVVKPVDLDQFFQVVKSIGDFWLTTARLPYR
jgi:two-component system, chemotaxis family, response regulator Rcp1